MGTKDNKTITKLEDFKISPTNKELSTHNKQTIAELEAEARDSMPSSIPMGAGADAPKRVFIDSTDLIHEFANDEERKQFMKTLVENKKYTVNIKQKSYRKGLKITFPKLTFSKKTKPQNVAESELSEIAKQAIDAKKKQNAASDPAQSKPNQAETKQAKSINVNADSSPNTKQSPGANQAETAKTNNTSPQPAASNKTSESENPVASPTEQNQAKSNN